MPPPPADDSTEGNQMGMSALEMEMSQGDVTMGDGDGAHEAESMETAGVAKET